MPYDTKYHTNPTPSDSIYIGAGLVLIHTRIWRTSSLHGKLTLTWMIERYACLQLFPLTMLEYQKSKPG